MRVHLTEELRWEACLSGDASCPLYLHMDELEAERTPVPFLQRLIAGLQPASEMDSDGTRYWYDSHRVPHRGYDLPAIIWADGSQEWYKHGKRHRLYGEPAVIKTNGMKWWALDGKLTTPEASLRASSS